PGFDTTHTMSIEVRSAVSASGVRIRPFERVRAALRQLPGVESISTARNLPLMFLTWRGSARRDDNGPSQRVDIMPVGPRYFETLRIPLLRGRDLVDRDVRDQGSFPTPVVVNRTLAERFFGAADPVGRTIVLEHGAQDGPDRALTIAGVARDSRTRSLDEDAHPVMYLPEVGDYLLVRVNGPASGAVRMIERAIWSADAIAWVDAQPLRAQLDFALRPARLGGGALAALRAVAVTMAMVGLYAVGSYGVNRRSFEIGVRLAIGAPRAGGLRMIRREGPFLLP